MDVHGGEDVCSRDFTVTEASVNVIGHVVGNVNLHKFVDAFVFAAVILHVLEGVIIVTISNNKHPLTRKIVEVDAIVVV